MERADELAKGSNEGVSLPSLQELAASAGFAVSDLLDEVGWEQFDGLSDLDKIRYRYLHSDCDDLALVMHLVLGWDIRAVTSDNGPLHRLVSAPDGRLLDATGWTHVNQIRSRYKLESVQIGSAGLGIEPCQSILDPDDPEQLHETGAAILYFDTEPFSTELRAKFEAFAESIGLQSRAALECRLVPRP